VSGKQRQLAILAVLSVMLCGMAGKMGETFATVIFACLTFGIVLLLRAITQSSDDAYRPCQRYHFFLSRRGSVAAVARALDGGSQPAPVRRVA
jgi:hypothetical protein